MHTVLDFSLRQVVLRLRIGDNDLVDLLFDAEVRQSENNVVTNG